VLLFRRGEGVGGRGDKREKKRERERGYNPY
jgi:hypothetical protein